MPQSLSERSRTNLKGVHPDLIKVVERALEILSISDGPDFFVNEGVRTPERQKDLYAQGRTKAGPKVTWTLTSNHFLNKRTGYGHAVDLYAFSFDPNQSIALSKAIIKAMMKAADALDVPIRSGYDWDMDGNYGERGEGDPAHFELWGY